MSQQQYKVVVPQGMGPGQTFIVNVGGTHMQVKVPANVYGGQTILIYGRASGQGQSQGHNYQQQHQQQQFQPPPAPHQPPPKGQAPPPTAQASGLKHQCQSSLDAQMKLMSLTSAPDPSLIFTAMDRDGGGTVSVDELQFGLSQAGTKFSMKTCKLLVNMYDPTRKGELNRSQFIALWGLIDEWRKCYDAHDKDKSGFVEEAELKDAVEQVGYRFSEKTYKKFMQVYDTDKKGGVGFDEFISLFCELHQITEAFKEKDTQRQGKAEFSYEEFIQSVYSIHL